MISLLLAIFGKDRIPTSIRLMFLTIGLSVLSYKIYRFKQAQKEIAKAQAIQMVMEQKMLNEATKTAEKAFEEHKKDPARITA